MRLSVFFILSVLFSIAASAETRLPRDFRMPGVATAAFSRSEVIYEPGSTVVTMIGYINFDPYLSLSRLLDRNPNIRTLYVDSQGGEAGSALALAELIHDHKLKLVVDGLCASACANFLFPAAVEKSVSPGSLVAIHATSWVIDNHGKTELVTGNEMDDAVFRNAATRLFERGWTQRVKSVWLAWKAGRWIDEFSRKYHTNWFLEKSFSNYLTRRKKLLGVEDVDSRPGSPDCPRIVMWALNRAQLEAMGVRGIQDFWYPQDKDKSVAQDLAFRQVPETIFFGGQRQMDMLCATPASRHTDKTHL